MQQRYPLRANLVLSLIIVVAYVAIMIILEGTEQLAAIIIGALVALVVANIALYALFRLRRRNR